MPFSKEDRHGRHCQVVQNNFLISAIDERVENPKLEFGSFELESLLKKKLELVKENRWFKELGI